MSHRFLFTILLSLITAEMPFAEQEVKNNSAPKSSSEFEGSKVGDRIELAPGIAFRWCPAGTFTMGSPESDLGYYGKHLDSENQVVVTLSKGFWLGETEVTQGQWQKLMETHPWKDKDFVKEGTEYAASYISHDDAVEFCKAFTIQEQKSERLPKGWKFSLPTEAQWEYACRAKSKTKFCFGDDESQLRDYGWFLKNISASPGLVGKKNPNTWGFKDMHGNVCEWCSDWFVEDLQGGRDPQGPSSGTYRVSRGGSLNSYAVGCRSAARSFDSPDEGDYNLGFRLAAISE